MQEHICIHCDYRTTMGLDTCPRCSSPLLLDGRFRALAQLGSGGSSSTYRVEDTDGNLFALKVLDMKDVEGWKTVEHFQRQFEILSQLHHPGVPEVHELFELELAGGLRHCLLQELIDGESLSRKLRHGAVYDEPTARRLLDDLLDTLDYLHGFSPSVIHRDIKPSNIVIRADGSPVLIDFDTAQARAVIAEHGEGTMVGTPGYTPMEQLAGQASTSSDIYALGMTLVVVLTRRNITDLPVERMRVNFEPYINVSNELREVLVGMTQPAVEDRLGNVGAVRALLDRPATPTRDAALPSTTSQTGPISVGLGYGDDDTSTTDVKPPRVSSMEIGLFEEEVTPVSDPYADDEDYAEPALLFDDPPTTDVTHPVPAKGGASDANAQSTRVALIVAFAAMMLVSGLVFVVFFAAATTSKVPFSEAPPPTSVVPSATAQSGQNILPTRRIWWAAQADEFSSQYNDTAWAAHRATGGPEVYPQHGDITGAWATNNEDRGLEWIHVSFQHQIMAKGVMILETYNPGAVARVDDCSNMPERVMLWSGDTDGIGTNTQGARALYLELQQPREMWKLCVYLDTSRVRGWNEIDAIGLVE